MHNTYTEKKADEINSKHSAGHAPSPGNKSPDNMTNAANVTCYSSGRFSENIMTLSEDRHLSQGPGTTTRCAGSAVTRTV